jgi:hypothetical protein
VTANIREFYLHNLLTLFHGYLIVTIDYFYRNYNLYSREVLLLFNASVFLC